LLLLPLSFILCQPWMPNSLVARLAAAATNDIAALQES
jgi:hypothetical protein